MPYSSNINSQYYLVNVKYYNLANFNLRTPYSLFLIVNQPRKMYNQFLISPPSRSDDDLSDMRLPRLVKNMLTTNDMQNGQKSSDPLLNEGHVLVQMSYHQNTSN